MLMATNLLAGAERASAREQMRSLPRLAAASATLAAAVQVLLELTPGAKAAQAPEREVPEREAAEAVATEVSLAEVWAQIERVAPRRVVVAALATVLALAPPLDEDADAAWRAELVKRYTTVRPFLPLLSEVIAFGAVEGGKGVLEALRQLPQLLRRKKVRAEEAPAGLVTGLTMVGQVRMKGARTQ